MSASEPLDIKNYIGLTGDTPIRFIASDVDGTLVNDAKSVDPEVVNAVRAARESGIRVAIASGRAWHEMDDVIEAMPCLRYFVCTNGAYVMDKEEQKELVHISFDKTRAVDLVLSLIHIFSYHLLSVILKETMNSICDITVPQTCLLYTSRCV